MSCIKTYISNIPKFMLLIIALCLVLQEFYPFSHFPMYSTFGSKSHYVYLADSNDEPIAIKKYFKYSAPKLKKMFVTRLNFMKKAQNVKDTTMELRKDAARTLLAYLVKESDPNIIKPIKVLKLYVVDIKLENKEIMRTPTLLAEVVL